jgi:hypothetical protein
VTRAISLADPAASCNRACMEATMDSLRERLRRWMIEAMEASQLSAERWGRLAGTAPTNITRFLKYPDAPIPTARTLSKLAAVGGIPVPVGIPAKLPLNIIPVLDATTVALLPWPASLQEFRAMLEQNKIGEVKAPYEASPEAFAILAPSERMAIAGIARNDLLIVEPRGEQIGGSVLLFKTKDNLVDIGVLEAGVLSARAYYPAIPFPIADVEILGRVMQHVKKL